MCLHQCLHTKCINIFTITHPTCFTFELNNYCVTLCPAVPRSSIICIDTYAIAVPRSSIICIDTYAIVRPMCFTFELNNYCVTLCLAVPHGPTLCLLCTLYTAPIYEDTLHGNSNRGRPVCYMYKRYAFLPWSQTQSSQVFYCNLFLVQFVSACMPKSLTTNNTVFVSAFVCWWDSTICL